MNFILEMYSKDHPEELKFERIADKQKIESEQNVMVGWADRLIGKAKDEFIKRISFALPPTYKKPDMPRYFPPPKKD